MLTPLSGAWSPSPLWLRLGLLGLASRKGGGCPGSEPGPTEGLGLFFCLYVLCVLRFEVACSTDSRRML